MPELGHLIIAFSIIIPIIYFSGDKFNYKVAAIFIIGNWIGPDSTQAFSFLPIDFHYIIPYLIWAVPLALFFSYFSRFSVKRSDRFFKLVDDGKRDVTWRNSYLLLVSSGLIHTISDTLFRNNLKIKFLENIFEPTLPEIHRYGFIFDLDIPILQMISYTILITVTLLAVFIVDKKFKDILVFFFTFIGVTVLIVFIFGERVVGGEYDVGASFLAVLFIFIPLMLLFYVAKDVNEHPTLSLEEPRINPELGLKIAAGLSGIIALFFLLIGILSITSPSIIQELIDFSESSFFILGIIFIILGGITTFAIIGLFLKINACRYIVISVCIFMTLFVYPLLIVLYLCQDNVKALFYKRKKAIP